MVESTRRGAAGSTSRTMRAVVVSGSPRVSYGNRPVSSSYRMSPIA